MYVAEFDNTVPAKLRYIVMAVKQSVFYRGDNIFPSLTCKTQSKVIIN